MEKIFEIAKRQNNNKRNFLIVNKYQGKHIPTSAHNFKLMLTCMCQKLDCYKDKNLLVIGFCETATAIGCFVATYLQKNYISTTREDIKDTDFINFIEEHSHAKEQKLVKKDIDYAINNVDEILFVEDEITTGNTILNIIDILNKNYSKKIRYSVISVINCMKYEDILKYEKKGINIMYYQKIDSSNFDDIVNMYNDCEKENIAVDKKSAPILQIKGHLDIRRITNINKYNIACQELSSKIINTVKLENLQDILVLGTEEFMYPAFILADNLEKLGKTVNFHSTTRSPIKIYADKSYPLNKRYEIRSFYDENRVNYVYNLRKYELVIIITDSKKDLKNELISALEEEKNENILIVRWT